MKEFERLFNSETFRIDDESLNGVAGGVAFRSGRNVYPEIDTHERERGYLHRSQPARPTGSVYMGIPLSSMIFM